MITLDTLSTQLHDQFYNPSFVAVPTSSRYEAIRQALAKLNATLVSIYIVDGLDGASANTLPDSHIAALTTGAAGFLLDFTIRIRLVTYPKSTELAEQLYTWAGKLKEEFDQALNRLHFIKLQESTNSPAFQIPSTRNTNDITLDS